MMSYMPGKKLIYKADHENVSSNEEIPQEF